MKNQQYHLVVKQKREFVFHDASRIEKIISRIYSIVRLSFVYFEGLSLHASFLKVDNVIDSLVKLS